MSNIFIVLIFILIVILLLIVIKTYLRKSNDEKPLAKLLSGGESNRFKAQTGIVILILLIIFIIKEIFF